MSFTALTSISIVQLSSNIFFANEFIQKFKTRLYFAHPNYQNEDTHHIHTQKFSIYKVKWVFGLMLFMLGS